MSTTPELPGVMRPAADRVKLLLERFNVPVGTLSVPSRFRLPVETLSTPPSVALP